MFARIRISHLYSLSLFGLFAILGGCSGGSGTSGGGESQPKTPTPTVTGIAPSSVPVGSPAFTLSVTGSNFQPQAVVNWNTTALATTYTSTSALSAAVPANLAATGSTANITVTNPDGQSTGGASSHQVSVMNPVPTLSTVAPQLLYAGSPDTVLTLTGTNFNSSSVVMAGTTRLATTFVSATQLTASAPAALLTPVGTLSVAVLNPAPGGGSSQTIPVTLSQPSATLGSLSPSTVTAGSSMVTSTLTGTYFTPTSLVYISNYPAATTTYISSTSIQFTIPPQSLISTGTLIVTVHDSAWPNNISNQLMLQVVNPVPVLSSISPVSITAGAPNFYLTLSGSNFVSSSMVLINGTPTQPESSSGTTASVLIPASAVSTVGGVTIAVSNPAPGGGTSASQTLNVISANNRIRTVNVEAVDLGWDPAHNLLIASTLSGSSNNPNSIVTIDPLQGTVITAASLPSQPSGISVTADGSYVYVTLPSTGQIERFTLPSLTPDITFGLGSANGKPNITTSVAAAPGAPHTVAVSLSNTSVSNNGMAVFDDGVVRSNIASPTAFGENYDTPVWGNDATTLYGSNAEMSTADEDIFSVNNSGVTLVSDQRLALGEFVRHLAFDTKTGRLVDGYGDVVTAASGQSAAQLQVQNTIGYEENPFALDTTQRTVFYLNTNGFYPNNPPNGTYIEAFSLDQFTYINSMLVNGLTGGSTIVRWGASGLAINGSSQIYLIDGSFVAPTGISSPAGGYIAPSPTLISVTPAAVTAGSADVKVTLTGRDFTQSSQVIWNNQTFPIDSVSDTQIVATIRASSLTSPVASGIAATNGPETASSGALGFTVLPDLGSGTQINTLDISGQDLAWDSKHNLLYVAVPDSDPVFPNTIAVVDPIKSALTQAIPVADNPSVISLSDDSQYLYSGFFGQAIIQRYALPSFSLDLTIPTGAGYPANTVVTHGSCTFAVEVKVAPGNPQSIAVTSGNDNIEPRGCGNLAIYDNATLRPGVIPSAQGPADFTSLAWGTDATTLYGQADYCCQPQRLTGLAVSATGVTLGGTLNSGTLGLRVHFDAGTKLLYSDSGVITNPVGPAQVGTFPSGAAVVTDSTLKRAFVLTSSTSNPSNNSGQGATSYTLNIYDLNTLGLLNSIVIPDVLGYPTRMTRWGSNGLAFVTNSQLYTTGSAGVLYILQGSGISGLP